MRIGSFNLRPVRLTFDDVGIKYSPFFGFIKSGKWTDLKSIQIETTDQGPFSEDVFYLLSFGLQTIRVEQIISGGLLNKMQALPGFDNEEVIKSMSSTSNAKFLIWKKQE